jgi:hypothetical protein
MQCKSVSQSVSYQLIIIMKVNMQVIMEVNY